MLKSCKYALCVVLMGSVLGCSGLRAPSPKLHIQDMVRPESPTQAGAEHIVGNSIVFSKSNLDARYLLQTSLITQDTAPKFNASRSRVVIFKKRGNQFAMEEASEGNVVSQDMEQNVILAVFPITKETESDISIDFNEGMSQLFVAEDWTHQDTEGTDHEGGYSAINVRKSFLEDLRYDHDHFVIRQLAQVEIPKKKKSLLDFSGDNGLTLQTVEAQYYLSVYAPDPTFQSTRAKGGNKFGFFEVSPKMNPDGSTKIYAAKFNISNPIVFAIHANAPEKYKNAIREGALYWNKAFDREIVRVIDAPVGVHAPNWDMNIIQWVNWDSAGYAFADAQMDPLTGQTMHAQIFLTSAFAFSSKDRVRSLLRKLNNTQSTPTAALGLSGLTTSHLCYLDNSHQLQDMLEKVVNQDLDDATILRISQDYVRLAVAHEVGHTLGLRHNFAGNLAQSFALSERSHIFSEYLLKNDVPDKVVVSSSIMDYLIFEEAVLQGHRMTTSLPALEYDQKAIKNLYFGQQFERSEVPPFCTDYGVSIYLDCKRFDTGRSAVEFASWRQKDMLETLKFNLVEMFVAAKTPYLEDDAIPVDEAQFDLSQFMAEYANSRSVFLDSFADGKLWAVNSGFVVDPLNEDLVKLNQYEYLVKETHQFGGIGSVLPALPRDFVARQSADFIALIDSGKYTNGISSSGKPYNFTEEELRVIKARGVAYIAKLHKSLVEADVEQLSKIKTITEGDLQTEFVNLLNARLVQYVMSTDPSQPFVEVKVKNKGGETILVCIPQFLYSYKVRKAAAALLKADRFQGYDVGAAQRQANKEMFSSLITDSIGDQETLDMSKLPRELRDWVAQAKEIKDLL